MALARSIDLATAPDAVTAAVDTSFTYQGSLLDGGAPVNDTCDFTFTLLEAATGGKTIGTNTRTGVVVEDGLFTVSLDFTANAFKGNARWLEIQVDCGSGAVTLSPRQPLKAAPYSLGLRPGAAIDADLSDPALTLSNTDGVGLEVSSENSNGINVSGASASGLSISGVEYGMSVSADTWGVYVYQTGSDGIYMFSAGGHGLNIFHTDLDGVHVNDADGDGLSVCATGSEDDCENATSTDNNGVEIN